MTKDYKRESYGRRKKDDTGNDMKNANFWLKVMTIIMTLSMFGITWIARDISKLSADVSANYTVTQVILTKVSNNHEKIQRETNERKEGDKLAKYEREEIRKKFNSYVIENYQSLNDMKYRK